MVFAKVVLFFVAVLYASATLPPFFKVCKKNDPDISRCILKSVNELKPKLAEGIPELKVPSIEPLLLDEIKLRSGQRSSKIDGNFTNINVWGPSTFEVKDLKVNLGKNKFIFKLTFPHLYFKGDYDIDMNVLILKYKGQGPITGNFTNVNCEIQMKGRIVKKEGKNHIQFNKFNLLIDIGKSYIHLGNLFGRDPNLGKATNEVVNGNSDLFINEIKPTLESSLAEKLTGVSNIICKTFTYEELFPAE